MDGLSNGNFGSTISVISIKFNALWGGIMTDVILNKLDSLRSVVRGYGSCLVAYSGGVDSALLTVVTHEQLGDRMLAVIADSPSLPRRELSEAKLLAEEHGIPLHVLHTSEFQNPDYQSNPVNRCFYCKHELFTHLKLLASDRSINVIVYGENTSDLGDWRPGAEAAAKFEVRSPLKEAGLSKENIREISTYLGLSTADKPQMPCLSSRIPYGQEVTPEKVGMIEKAEFFLRDMGFNEVRVRHHESGPVARIEVVPEQLDQLRVEETFEAVRASFTRIGYAEVQVDEQGYRRGSLNPSEIKI